MGRAFSRRSSSAERTGSVSCRVFAGKTRQLTLPVRSAEEDLREKALPMSDERLLESGFTHHRAGRFAQAAEVYRAILTRHPDHADALHLLGLTFHQNG